MEVQAQQRKGEEDGKGEQPVRKDNKRSELIKCGERKTKWGWSGLIGSQVIVCLLNILIHDVII